MGGYERPQRPVHRHRDRPTTRSRPTSTAGCCRRDWDRFTEIAENAQVRVPALADAGIAHDDQRSGGRSPRTTGSASGETEVPGFFVAAGFCAHGIAGAGGVGQVMAAWILDGDPGMDTVAHGRAPVRPAVSPTPGYTLARMRENYESYYDLVPS